MAWEGGAWRGYVSLKPDDPSFRPAIYANLEQTEGDKTVYILNRSR